MLFILLFRFILELLVEIEEEADVQHHAHRRGDGGRQTDLRQAGVGLDQQLSFFSVLYVPKRKCLSSTSPAKPMALPMVNAAAMVPMPRPSRWWRKPSVRPAVTARQMTSKPILILGYGMPVISASSRGNRSVGTMGSLQRLESAMPRLISQ